MHDGFRSGLSAFVLGFLALVPAVSQAGSDEVAFSKQELQAFLTGKTYPLSSGAFYFESNEKMVALWKGKTEETTWWATDDSQFCYSLKVFGGEECLGLFKKGDDRLIQVFEGQRRKLKISDVKEGKAF